MCEATNHDNLWNRIRNDEKLLAKRTIWKRPMTRLQDWKTSETTENFKNAIYLEYLKFLIDIRNDAKLLKETIIDRIVRNDEKLPLPEGACPRWQKILYRALTCYRLQ